MITEIADAAEQLIRLADDLPRQTQTRRMESLNLRLGGLRHGILVHVAVAE